MPAPFQLGSICWDWERPRVLGIVNVTPDSFSDGGRNATREAAVRHAMGLVEQGADAIDVGGESTRPHAESVDLVEECARVLPVVRALAARGVVVSIDTRKAEVARRALGEGARIVNDVGMGDPPEAMGAEAARAGAGYLAMHARGTPATMTTRADYDDLERDVSRELLAFAARLQAAGVAREQVVLDPGIGFAKTAAQSLRLLSGIARLCGLGYAVCVGPSRKSFIAAPASHPGGWPARDVPAHERVGGTAAAVALAVAGGANLVRVHDVAVMAEAARVAHAIRLAGGGPFTPTPRDGG